MCVCACVPLSPLPLSPPLHARLPPFLPLSDLVFLPRFSFSHTYTHIRTQTYARTHTHYEGASLRARCRRVEIAPARVCLHAGTHVRACAHTHARAHARAVMTASWMGECEGTREEERESACERERQSTRPCVFSSRWVKHIIIIIIMCFY
jgi:hypothetical protein